MKRSTKTISIILVFFLIIAIVIIGRTMIGNHFKKKFSKRPPPGIIVTEVVEKEFFGIGSNETISYWRALIRQLLVAGLLKKEIETYGVIKLTAKGEAFLASPHSFFMTENHEYDQTQSTPSSSGGGTAVFDKKLHGLLMKERKRVAEQSGVPPCFGDFG